MGRGMLHRLVAVLLDIFRAPDRRCEPEELERIAILVHRVMSRQSRQFHTLEHVFGFLDGADAETATAAIFHDLVYFQIDEGLPPELGELLGSSIRVSGLDIYLSESDADEACRLCRGVFGFSPGQKVGIFAGLNEYLSALAMMRLLLNRVPAAFLVAVAACIEASVPFRGPDAEGREAADILAIRLDEMAAAALFDASAGSLASMVHRAVAFGNHDVRDFALDDPGEFLSNTWKLLPESNAALRVKGAFSIHEYRVALEKMQAFFQSLDPEKVYHAWDGEPDEASMRRFATKTHRNLAWAINYMNAKLLAAGLLEAVAILSGGDAPMALFMGDIGNEAEEYESIAALLPFGSPPWLDRANPVYRLLRDGRLDESSFDLKNSPLALYLYEKLEPSAWGRATQDIRAFFDGSLGAEAFLDSLPAPVLDDFLEACESMAPTRKTALTLLRRPLP
ncbi:MAG TPA: hypothetical protein VMV44_12355 [Rectinemataceae bacterium]|nr:hypothetical protein [Rectinemataceae bacterium]